MLLLQLTSDPVIFGDQPCRCCQSTLVLLLLEISPVVVADQLWDSHPGEGVPAAQCRHQLYAGQRGLMHHGL